MLYQIWHDGIAAYVFGDVLLGVVGTHLGTIVDILLEDITQHVGVDIFSCCCDAVVEVPVPLVEESKKTFEGFVSNIEIGIVVLNLVLVEHTTVEVGNATIDVLEFVIMLRGIQSTVEEGNKESLVERVEETVFAPFALCPLQLVLQVIHIAVEKPLLLYEIAKHQSVEHHRGVPLLVAVVLFGHLVVDA